MYQNELHKKQGKVKNKRRDLKSCFTYFSSLIVYKKIAIFEQVCTECSEEFCSGTCKNFQYDSYQRLIIEEKEKDGPGGGGVSGLNADKLGGVGMEKAKPGKDRGRGPAIGKKGGKPGKKEKRKGGKNNANILAGMPI